MKHERQRRTPNNYIWSRILERYRCRRGLFRPRVPLVLRRHGVPARAEVMRGNVRPTVSHYQFALHLHLSSLWWPPGSARHLAPQEPARHHTVLRTLLEHAGQAAGRPMRTSGSAPRGHDVMRSWSETPSSHGPSVRALSSHTLSARTKSAPTLSARALPSTTSSSNATRMSSNGTSALVSGPRHIISLQRISSPPLWSARSGRVGGSRAPKAIPDRVTRHALLTRSVFAETVVQRHPQHVANTFNASHEVVRLGSEVVGRSGAMKGAGRNGRTWTHSARLSTRARANDTGDPHGPPWSRSAPTSAVRRAVSAPFHPVLMAAARSSRRPVQRRGEGRPSVMEGMRSPLYAQPAARSFANYPAATTAQQAPAPEQRAAPSPPAHVQALQPQIDLERLTEDVYQHLQRKIRIERERRGL